MAKRKSVKGLALQVQREDAKLRTKPKGSAAKMFTGDSYQNFAAKLGVGTDNMSSGGSYGFNPISRNQILLEWMHRGSWIAGQAVDVVAKDMTRAGIELGGTLLPQDVEHLKRCAVRMAIWDRLCQTIQWGRLFGGALAVMLIDGQPMDTPLRLNTIGKGQFKGLVVLDRWMLIPSLENLVTEFGPHLGMPKYYRVLNNAPALSGSSIHYTRCVRLEGCDIPYRQKLMENLWTTSVLERLYDRLMAFDSATAGAAQLVFKSYLRTFYVKDMKDAVTQGGDEEQGLARYVQMMARFQSIEGISIIDGEDKIEAQTHGAFSGLSEVLSQFGQQLSGALEIPLTRLFGQSPSGFSSGDNEVRTYYDGINQKQETNLRPGVTSIYDAMARSEGIVLGDDFTITFKPLWQLSEKDKSDIAKQDTETVINAEAAALVSPQTALKELRQSSHVTGRWTNITDKDISDAEQEVQPPDPVLLQPGAKNDAKAIEQNAGNLGDAPPPAKLPPAAKGADA